MKKTEKRQTWKIRLKKEDYNLPEKDLNDGLFLASSIKPYRML